MGVYHTKCEALSGTSWKETHAAAKDAHKSYIGSARRRAYIRSPLFQRDKVFIDTYWRTLGTRNFRDRQRRLSFLPCGLELIKHAHFSKQEVVESKRRYYHFDGVTPAGKSFSVHIKEDGAGRRYLMSVFPYTRK